MSVFDHFQRETHIFNGEVPKGLNIENMDDLIAQHGIEWVTGYLSAMEVFAVDMADVLTQRENNPCGFKQTPHQVRTKLKEYWEHNRSLYLLINSQINPDDALQESPTPR